MCVITLRRYVYKTSTNKPNQWNLSNVTTYNNQEYRSSLSQL